MAVGKEFILMFSLGMSVGVLFSMIYIEISRYQPHALCTSTVYEEEDDTYMHDDGHDHRRLRKHKISPSGPIVFNDLDDLHHKGGDKLARKLAQKVRVLCWVMTSPKTLKPKAQAVKDTWGKRCNILLFMSSKADKDFPAVGLNVPEGRENLWLKTRAAWKYVYENHLDDADWFIKADDDSFVIVENLRYLLLKYNTNEPHYFGRWFKPFGGYNSGGAGYVFSKETLRKFIKIMKNPSKCKLQSFAEDAEVGVCLQAAGIHPDDSRDDRKRERFHPFAPEYHLIPGIVGKDNWLYSYNNFPVKDGPECCSDHTVTFHYIDPNNMYILEYLIYHLRPYGIQHINHSK